MLVPEIEICLSSKHLLSLNHELHSAAQIPTPGAVTSGLTSNVCTGPRDEKLAILSLSSDAPTVIAFLDVPGLRIVSPDGPELPAAIVATMPASTAASTALLTASSGFPVPPRLIVIISAPSSVAGFLSGSAALWIAAITFEKLPEPPLLR